MCPVCHKDLNPKKCNVKEHMETNKHKLGIEKAAKTLASDAKAHLKKLVTYAFIMITSSASVERAFSILKRCFGHQQRLALEDYSMLSCMLQANIR